MDITLARVRTAADELDDAAAADPVGGSEHPQQDQSDILWPDLASSTLNADTVRRLSYHLFQEVNSPQLTRDCFNTVTRLLQGKADPRCKYTFTLRSGRNTSPFEGNALHVAAMRGELSILKKLLKHSSGAPASEVLLDEYSFQAGKTKTMWSGCVPFAAIPRNHSSILLECLELNIHVNTKSSNGATLLWNASHFGHTDMVRELLRRRADIDACAVHQDKGGDAHSAPIHMATEGGHEKVVRQLISASVDAESVKECLDDAMRLGHAGIVKLLVVHSPELLLPKKSKAKPHKQDSLFSWASMAWSPSKESSTPLDKLFESNELVIAAAAEALQHTPPETRANLTLLDFIRFLKTPGDASQNIIRAIFVERKDVRFWQKRQVPKLQCLEVQQSASRAHHHHFRNRYDDLMAPTKLMVAHLHRPRERGQTIQTLNVASGPSAQDLDTIFRHKMSCEYFFKGHAFQNFLSVLAPQLPKKTSDNLEYVKIHQCLLPDVHHSLKVLSAITSTSSSALLDVPGCQAISMHAWHQARKFSKLALVVHFVNVLLLLPLTEALRSVRLAEPQSQFLSSRGLACMIMPCAAFAVLTQALQIIGFASQGLLLSEISNFVMWFDATRNSAQFMALGAVWIYGDEVRTSVAFRIGMAILMFSMWIKALFSLRIHESLGVPIVPIINALWKIAPFCGVLMFHLCGFAHSYYTLDIREGLLDCLLVVYRLGLLGDLDLQEFEGVDPVGTLEGNTLTLSDEKSENFYISLLMLVIISFVVLITLMNIFIAVLGASYDLCYANAWRNFVLTRARIGVDYAAQQEGLLALTYLCRHRRSSTGAKGSSVEGAGVPKDLFDELSRAPELLTLRRKKREYIWFCCKVSEEGDAAVSEEMKSDAVHEKMQEAKTTFSEEQTIKRLLPVTKWTQDFTKRCTGLHGKFEQQFESVKDALDNLKRAAAHDAHSRRHARKARRGGAVVTNLDADPGTALYLERSKRTILSTLPSTGMVTASQTLSSLTEDEVYFGYIHSFDAESGHGLITPETNFDNTGGKDVILLPQHVVGGLLSRSNPGGLALEDGDRVSFLVVPPTKDSHQGYSQARQVCKCSKRMEASVQADRSKRLLFRKHRRAKAVIAEPEEAPPLSDEHQI